MSRYPEYCQSKSTFKKIAGEKKFLNSKYLQVYKHKDQENKNRIQEFVTK